MSATNSQTSLSPSASDDEEESFKEPAQSKLKFYTSDEIVIHNNPEDFWVTVNQVVFDLTSMIQTKPKPLSATIQYLLAFGGKDLSSYFDEAGMPKLQVSSFTGKKVPIFPAVFEKLEEDEKYWWEDEKYQVGRVTRLERPIRIINTLTAKVHKMVVCDEDTIADIQLKYRNLYNHHAGSYTWRKNFKDGKPSARLCFDKTLTENGMFPLKNDIGPAPAFWLYYNDDFTIA